MLLSDKFVLSREERIAFVIFENAEVELMPWIQIYIGNILFSGMRSKSRDYKEGPLIQKSVRCCRHDTS